MKPEEFHHFLNCRSWNQSLNDSQPKVSMINFLCWKSEVVCTTGRWPGTEQTAHGSCERHFLIAQKIEVKSNLIFSPNLNVVN